MDETTVQNLASVSDLLKQAIEAVCRGEDFSLDFADDWLHSFFGAVVELARLSGSGDRENLSRAEAFLAGVSQRVDDGDDVVFTAEHLEALQSLQCLARAARPMAEVLDREDGRLYALINPANSLGNTVLGENDRGVYENPWAALADLAEVKRYAQNPDIYLAYLVSAKAVVNQVEAVAVTRHAMYDRLVTLAWQALDKLDIADGIVDSYDDGTSFCAGLCENLRELLRETEVEELLPTGEQPIASTAEVIVLYVPDNDEVLLVNGQVIDDSDGPDSGDYIAEPERFFRNLGRALGIHFTVRSIKVDPYALVGEYWSWDEVVAAWLATQDGGSNDRSTDDFKSADFAIPTDGGTRARNLAEGVERALETRDGAP